MSIEVDLVLDEIQRNSNLLTSVEADFATGIWSFRAPYFQCGAGEYLVISKHDFDRIRTAHTARQASDEPR